MAKGNPNDLPQDYVDMSVGDQMRELSKLSRMSEKSGKRKKPRESQASTPEELKAKKSRSEASRISDPDVQIVYLEKLASLIDADLAGLSKDDYVIVFGSNEGNADTGTNKSNAGQALDAYALKQAGFEVLGIPTRTGGRGGAPLGYVTDDLLETDQRFKDMLNSQFKKLNLAISNGKKIIFPRGGVGTGRAKLGSSSSSFKLKIDRALARAGIDNATGLSETDFAKLAEDPAPVENKTAPDIRKGTEGKDGFVYHYTQPESVDSIVSKGITPDADGRIYFFDTLEAANEYIFNEIENRRALEGKPVTEGKPAIVAVPRSDLAAFDLKPDNAAPDSSASYIETKSALKISDPYVMGAEESEFVKPTAPSENTKISGTAATSSMLVEPDGESRMHYIKYELVTDEAAKASSSGTKQMSFSYGADKGKVEGERESNTFDEILKGRRTSTLRSTKYGPDWVEGKVYEIKSDDGRSAFVKVTSNKEFDPAKVTPEQWAAISKTERWSQEYLQGKYGKPGVAAGAAKVQSKVDTRDAWKIPNNIYSRVQDDVVDMAGLRGALTNRTNDIEKTTAGGVQDAFSADKYNKTVIKSKYPVVLDGKIYPSAEHAYYDISNQRTQSGTTASEDDMSRIIAEKLRQHPKLLDKLTELGGRSWIEKQSHFTGYGIDKKTGKPATSRIDRWQGEGLRSGFIRSLAAAFDAAIADPVGETLSTPKGEAMVKWAQDKSNWDKFPVATTSEKSRNRQTFYVPESVPADDQPIQSKWSQMEKMSYPNLPSERLGTIMRGTGAYGMAYDSKSPFVSREATPDLAGSTIHDVIARIATRNGVDLTAGGQRTAGLATELNLSKDEKSLDPKYLGRLFDTLIAAAEHLKMTTKEGTDRSKIVGQMGVSGSMEVEDYVPARTVQTGAEDLTTGKIPTMTIPPQGGQLKATQSQRPFADVPPKTNSVREVIAPGSQDQQTMLELSMVLRKVSQLLSTYADPRSSFTSRYSYRFGERKGTTSPSAEIAGEVAGRDLNKSDIAEQIAKMKPGEAGAVAQSISPSKEGFESPIKKRPFNPQVESMINPDQKVIDSRGILNEDGSVVLRPASLIAELKFKPNYKDYQFETGLKFTSSLNSKVNRSLANTLRYFPGLFVWQDEIEWERDAGKKFTRSPMSSFSPEFEYSGGYAAAVTDVNVEDGPLSMIRGDIADGEYADGRIFIVNLGKLIKNRRMDALNYIIETHLSQEASARNELRGSIMADVGPAVDLSRSLDAVPREGAESGKLIDIKSLIADVVRANQEAAEGIPNTPESKRRISIALGTLNKIDIAIAEPEALRLNLDGVDSYVGTVAPNLVVRSNAAVLPGGAIVDLDPTYMQAFGFPKVLPWQVKDGQVVRVDKAKRGAESPTLVSPNKVDNEAVSGTQKMLLSQARNKTREEFPAVILAGETKRSTEIDQVAIEEATKNFVIDQIDILDAQKASLDANPGLALFVKDSILRIDPDYEKRANASIDDVTGATTNRYSFPIRKSYPVDPDIATGRVEQSGGKVRASSARPIYSPVDKTRAVRDLLFASDAIARLGFRFATALAYGSKKVGEGDLRPLGAEAAKDVPDADLIQRWTKIARTMSFGIEEAARIIDPDAGNTFDQDGVRMRRVLPDFDSIAAKPEVRQPAPIDAEASYSSYADEEFDYGPPPEQDKIKIATAQEESPALRGIATEVARYLSGEATDDEIAALRKLFSGDKMGSVDDARQRVLSMIDSDPDVALALIFREAWSIRTNNAGSNLVESALLTYRGATYKVTMGAGTTVDPSQSNPPPKAVASLEPVGKFPTRSAQVDPLRSVSPQNYDEVQGEVGMVRTQSVAEPSFKPRTIELFSGDRFKEISKDLGKSFYDADAIDLYKAINGFANDILNDPTYADKIESELTNRYGLDSIIRLGPRNLFFNMFNMAMTKGPQEVQALMNRFQEPRDIGTSEKLSRSGNEYGKFTPVSDISGEATGEVASPRSRIEVGENGYDPFESAFDQAKTYSVAGQNPIERIRNFTAPSRGATSQRYYHGWHGFGGGAVADAAVMAAKGYLTPEAAAQIAAFNAVNLVPKNIAPKVGGALAVGNVALTAAAGGDVGRALATTTGSILGGLAGGYFSAGLGTIAGSITGGEIADFIHSNIFGKDYSKDQYNRTPDIDTNKLNLEFRP